MKIIILFAIVLGGCIPSMSQDTHLELTGYLEAARSLQAQQRQMIHKKAPPKEVEQIILGLNNYISAINGVCRDTDKVPSYLFSTCWKYQLMINPIESEMQLTAANNYSDHCQTEEAKRLYRKIIIDNPANSSIFKMATFGLDDLWSKKCNLAAGEK